MNYEIRLSLASPDTERIPSTVRALFNALFENPLVAAWFGDWKVRVKSVEALPDSRAAGK